nr:uncharacterized protein LOC116766411 [Danaus plexippus plexippus]
MVKVAVGNEALIKLKTSLEGQSSCVVRSPRGQEFDIFNTPPSDKYERWSDGCGVRIKDVRSEDLGRWRLSSSRGNNSLTGWSELHVLEDTTRYDAPPISLQDGAQAKVELSSLDNSYCVVAKPFSDSSLVPGKCSVTLDRTTRAVQGNWQVYLGLPGQVSELQTNRHVTVHSKEHLSFILFHMCELLHFLSVHILQIHYRAVLDRFYFTPNRSIDVGDCSLNIISVQEEDVGEWTCAAVVDGEVHEARDTVTLDIGDQSYPLYQAGLIGTAVGVAVLVFVFIGFMGYKRGWYQLLGLRPARQDSSAISEAPVTFSTRSRSLTSTTLSSCSSEDSAVQRQ